MRKRLLSAFLIFALVLDSSAALAKATPAPSKDPSVQSVTVPTVSPSPSPTAQIVENTPTASEPSESKPWFDHCALIGDSISDGLRLYSIQKKKKEPDFLGNMQFLTRSSYSLTYASSAKPKMLVKYKGGTMRPEEALEQMGADKVFIMLGINDIFHDGSENTEKYNKLIDNIRAKIPNIRIGLIAITPIVTEGQYSAFQNTKVDEYNVVVKNICSGRRCEYIDFNSQLRDKTGGLKEEYSRDGFVHLKGGAFEIYAAALEKNAQYMDR